MEADRYKAWVSDIVQWAETQHNVLAVIGAGSTGSPRADVYSDHDILVFTANGTASQYRDDLAWLPSSDTIIYVHVETIHGRGVIYDDGHLVEVAVIDVAELEVIRLNEYNVLVDKANLSDRLAAVATRTSEETTATDTEAVFGSFLQDMIVGVNRYARGERLSGNSRIRGRATSHLIALLAEKAEVDAIDNLDPHRRFEVAFPDLADRLDRALEAPLPTTAKELAAIAADELEHIDAATPQVLEMLIEFVARVVPTTG